MPDEILVQLKDRFPHGYDEHMLRLSNAKGELFSAVPFETDETVYLVRMNHDGAYHFVEEDLDGIEEKPDDGVDSFPEAANLEFDDSEE